jgi:hypothetical protein
MIDTAVILFSTLMCVIVLFRAIKLDGQLPWYGKGSAGAEFTEEERDAS